MSAPQARGRRLTRLAPGGSSIAAGSLLATLRPTDAEKALRNGIASRLGAPIEAVSLHRSGREALRVGLSAMGARSGREEVLIPAYACYSIAAAAVAAGLRVRLVDVDLSGRIDPASLETAELDRVAAVVVTNLFGVPEPLGVVSELAGRHGVAVVDDAAQALGASSDEGPTGGRGDVGVLSFGRGKPLSALGGGALVWHGRPPEALPPPPEPARRLLAVARGLAYDVARLPVVLRLLASIPSLGIGETVYDPGFHRGPIQGTSLPLAAALLPGLDREGADRARRAARLGARIASETSFLPLLASNGETAVHPRLGVLAPDGRCRNAALDALRHLGATAMYPSALGDVAGLAPHVSGRRSLSGASEFNARLLTLPTHGGLRGRKLDEVLAALAGLSRGQPAG